MKTFARVLGLGVLCIGAAAINACSSDDAESAPASSSSTTGPKWEGKPNGTFIDEDVACARLVKAYNKVIGDSKCVYTGAPLECPTYFRSLLAADLHCADFDEGTVSYCADTYIPSLSCNQLAGNPCALTVRPDPAAAATCDAGAGGAAGAAGSAGSAGSAQGGAAGASAGAGGAAAAGAGGTAAAGAGGTAAAGAGGTAAAGAGGTAAAGAGGESAGGASAAGAGGESAGGAAGAGGESAGGASAAGAGGDSAGGSAGAGGLARTSARAGASRHEGLYPFLDRALSLVLRRTPKAPRAPAHPTKRNEGPD